MKRKPCSTARFFTLHGRFLAVHSSWRHHAQNWVVLCLSAMIQPLFLRLPLTPALPVWNFSFNLRFSGFGHWFLLQDHSSLTFHSSRLVFDMLPSPELRQADQTSEWNLSERSPSNIQSFPNLKIFGVNKRVLFEILSTSRCRQIIILESALHNDIVTCIDIRNGFPKWIAGIDVQRKCTEERRSLCPPAFCAAQPNVGGYSLCFSTIMPSILPVLFVLVVVVGLMTCAAFFVPKGPQQVYVPTLYRILVLTLLERKVSFEHLSCSLSQRATWCGWSPTWHNYIRLLVRILWYLVLGKFNINFCVL